MSSSTTPKKTQKITARQRLSVADIEDASSLAGELDEELAWASICDFPAVLSGFHVAHAISRTFSATKGIAFLEGKLVKSIDALTFLLEENPSGHPRLDLVEITGETETTSDSASIIALSSITRTSVSDEAVGSGDGIEKIFDLAHSGVDNRFLRAYVDGEPVANFKLLRGSGGGGVDQLLFHEPVPDGLSIDADYVWQSGGVEAASTQPTRKVFTPQINVKTGTPAAEPAAPAQTPGSVKIAQILVPAGWTGGAPSSIQNSVKEFAVAPDSNVDPYSSHADPLYGGRISNAIRYADQILHGFRLQYIDDDTIRVTAGWGVLGGVSFRANSPIQADLEPEEEGWHYIYLHVASLADELPGSTPTLHLSTEPPTERRRQKDGQARVYIGAVYVLNTEPIVIRPFFTQGSWVIWAVDSGNDTSLLFNVPGATDDIDISAAIPPTGRLAFVELETSLTACADGAVFLAQVMSHKTTGALNPVLSPRLQCMLHAAKANPALVESRQGMIHAFEDSGSRYVRGASATASGTIETASAKLSVLGYIDDYRTMDQNGDPSPY